MFWPITNYLVTGERTKVADGERQPQRAQFFKGKFHVGLKATIVVVISRRYLDMATATGLV